MKCKGARLWQTMQIHVWQSSAIYKSLQHQLCIYRFFNAKSTNHDWNLHQSNKGQSLEKEKTWKEHVQGIICTEYCAIHRPLMLMFLYKYPWVKSFKQGTRIQSSKNRRISASRWGGSSLMSL
jgi:hypothetical protein